MPQICLIAIVFALVSVACAAKGEQNIAVATRDIAIVADAFEHGYTHNLIVDVVDGKAYPNRAIQCAGNCVHHPYFEDLSSKQHFFRAGS